MPQAKAIKGSCGSWIQCNIVLEFLEEREVNKGNICKCLTQLVLVSAMGSVSDSIYTSNFNKSFI
jgi:hypothetical protein